MTKIVGIFALLAVLAVPSVSFAGDGGASELKRLEAEIIALNKKVDEDLNTIISIVSPEVGEKIGQYKFNIQEMIGLALLMLGDSEMPIETRLAEAKRVLAGLKILDAGNKRRIEELMKKNTT